MNRYIAMFKRSDIYGRIWIIFVFIPLLTAALYVLKLLLGIIGFGFKSPGYAIGFSFTFLFSVVFIVCMLSILYLVSITLANSFEPARKSLFGIIALLCAAAFLILLELALLNGIGLEV